MTITQDQLKACAERLWPIAKKASDPSAFGDGIYETLRGGRYLQISGRMAWDYTQLLTPNGREAMERAIIAEGGDVTTSYDCYEPLHWRAYITVPNPKPAAIPYMESSARSDSPAAALILAICGLPKVQA
jgi:hypothetical protein